MICKSLWFGEYFGRLTCVRTRDDDSDAATKKDH